MKRLHFAVGLFTAVACSGLQAQTPLRANIPFEFRMGHRAVNVVRLLRFPNRLPFC